MVREHKRQDKTKYKISREMKPVAPGLNTIKVVTAKPPLNKSLNQFVFTARFTIL